MTPQLKLVTTGAVATAITKFYFQKDWQLAILYGLAAISIAAILTAQKDENK